MMQFYKYLGFVVLCLGFSAPASALTGHEQQVMDVFERTAPSVAFIRQATVQMDWFSADGYEVPRGAGSGFVWDKEGHIITNFHVIYQADRITVTLANQEAYPAKIVGISPDHDLAVLKITADEEDLVPVNAGTSADLQVGQLALSIGNPFGLDHSLTTGVVSALGRNIRSMTGRKIYDVIQTDAAINPGNSGGPLLNSEGQLIGVSTAIYSPSGAYAGVGFAIPVDVVNRVVPQLIRHGRVKQVGLGVVLIPDRVRRRVGVKGAMILETAPGTPAERAGLRSTLRSVHGNIRFGDVIQAVDGQEVSNNDDLLNILQNKSAGEEITLTIRRDEKVLIKTATLQEL
ncbi:MAG: S1C family serine protease [Candidatus Omnitrophota bacterium]